MASVASVSLLDGDPAADDRASSAASSQQSTGDAYSSKWRRNELLTYASNFIHMAIYTMCLGGIFDVFVYDMSQRQHVIVSAPTTIGTTSEARSSFMLDTFSDFELTFQIRPSPNLTIFPVGSDCLGTFTCASSIMHFTDGQGNGDCCQVGNRIPFLFFPNASTQLFVDMDAIGQNTSADRRQNFREHVCSAPTPLPVNAWTAVKIKESSGDLFKGKVLHNHSWALTMSVNGTQVCTVPGTENKRLPARKHVTAFIGSMQAPVGDLHPAAQAELKAVKYGKPASNLIVGMVNSVQGILSLLIAYPIGWLGDRFSRYKLSRGSMFLALVSGVLLASGVFLRRIALLVAGVIVFSVYQQTISTTLSAILADNVISSRRTAAGVNWKTFSALAMAFGPGMQLLVILLGPSEDSWTKETFDGMLCPGWLALPLLAVSVCCLVPVGQRFSTVPNTDEVPTAVVSRHSSGRIAIDAGWLAELVVRKLPRWLVVASSANIFFIATLLANGMTVRYFSLYFTQILKFSPAQLCALNVVCRLWIAGVAQLGKPLAQLLGRANAAILLHLLSAAFTLGIYGGGWFEPNIWLACGSYLMRFACLHTRDPILYAITMDVVPLQQRSRWAALNSIRTLSFAASAVLGGYLADRYGYEVSFSATVFALLASTATAFPLLIWFPRSEGSKRPLDSP